MGAQEIGSLLSRDIYLYRIFKGGSVLTFAADAVCPAASDSTRDPLPFDADPASDDDGELQGDIQYPPPHKDYDPDSIKEELDHLVSSTPPNEVNMEKVLQSVVVDVPHTSYNNRKVLYKCLMGFLVCCSLIRGQCLRQSMRNI